MILNDIESLILLVIICVVVTKIVKQNKKDNNNPKKAIENDEWPENYQETEYKYQETSYQEKDQRDWTQCYQRTHLLTKNEYQEYKKLKYYADQSNLIICPKVRLLDIIIPKEGRNNLAALGKINSKHVDFVICDNKLYIKGIVELDDNSHKQPDRIERDRFVDTILTSVGYKVIHTYSVTEDTLSYFVEKK